ncbi:MAG: trigger factor [Acidimicrobiaceae bacterium]|nr:trigger factor [Acidimicrobiaceae bacterium]MBO0747522.1 trigger factor [Acidimicrobiaceae bacterium]
MKALVEPLEGNKVKLSVEVDEAEFEQAVEAAFKKIAREVRIPGFRPGKAPRRVLEARLGKEAGRAEALRDALPDYYARAVRDNAVDVIAAPEIDITKGEEEGPVGFDAIVEVRPHLQLVGYEGLRVEIPSPEVSEEEISAQIDRLRANFGQLSETESPAANGFHLTLDLHATRDGKEVPALSTDDFVYELGSGSVLPELDEHLQGVKAGETRTFEADWPEGPVTLEVAVKDVKENVLPEVTDDWASEASEFDTVEELRADIVQRAEMMKKVQANMALRNGTIEALVELVDIDAPQPLIDSEVERQAHELGHRIEAQGLTFQQYLEATGRTQEQIVEELRTAAVPAVKADLALRAVAEGEGIEPTEDDLAGELARLADAYNVQPTQLILELQRNDQLGAVRSDLKKSKALEWLVEHVEVVDDKGQPVDRALLKLETEGVSEPESPAAEVVDSAVQPEEPGGPQPSAESEEE